MRQRDERFEASSKYKTNPTRCTTRPNGQAKGHPRFGPKDFNRFNEKTTPAPARRAKG
jgi:hypothetical protein